MSVFSALIKTECDDARQRQSGQSVEPGTQETVQIWRCEKWVGEPTDEWLCIFCIVTLVNTKYCYSQQLCETHFRWCSKPLQWQEIICVETSERQVLSLKLIYRPLVWRLLCQAAIVVGGNIIIVFPRLTVLVVLTVENQGWGGHRSDQLSLSRYEWLQQHDGILVVTPGVHLPIGVPALLSEFVPGLGFAQQLTDGSLGQSQHVLGEQSLPDVVDRQELPHPEQQTLQYFPCKLSANFYGCLGYFPNDEIFLDLLLNICRKP